MTTLMTILSIVGLISICYAVGKYNKSDALFWTLLISLLAGMAGGAISAKLSDNSDEREKRNDITQVNPTQELPAASIDFFALLGSAYASEQNPVGKEQEIPAFGSNVINAPSMSTREIRRQPNQPNPLNKGTPGMPFNTS